jgi:long-chain acyl-CoA synthetase
MANFAERIEQTAARSADRTAIELTGGTVEHRTTYADLVALAGGFAQWLDAAGIVPGDRVAILAENSARWIAAYLGILRLGAVAVPLDTNYSAAQVRTVVVDSGARVVFASDRLHDVAASAVAAAGTPVSVARLSMPVEPGSARPVVSRTDADSAVILYTSGTTADPKGVVLTHGNLDAERAGALAVVSVSQDDAVLGVLPLFHALAQMANLLLPLTAGARVVFLESVSSATLLAALESRGISIFACVPQFFYLIHQRVTDEVAKRGAVGRLVFRSLLWVSVWLRDHTGPNLGRHVFARVHRAFGPRMRILVTGGSRIDPAIARDLYGMGLTLLNGYGLTETSGAATIVRPGDRFTTSVGQPLPGVSVRIEPDAAASAEGTMEPGSGEILIKGPIVMREYFGRPDATAAAMSDDWFRTGDLGRLDADGRVYITGRKKEVIVLSSGKNLYPEEIEGHYRQSPFIKELCVLGLSEPGAPASERLHAVIVADEDALRARGVVNVGELVRFEIENLSVQLPAHKRVLTYDISTSPLPRTTTGKLKRGEIERQLRSRATVASGPEAPVSAEDDQWLEDVIRRPLVETMRERLGRAIVRPGDHLELDLHLDSMERVEVLSRLEQQQGTRVPPEVRATIFSVRALIEAVIAAPSARGATPTTAADDRSEWDALLKAPADGALAADLARPTFLRAAIFFGLLRIVKLAWRLSFRVSVRGTANLSGQGPCLITPNHQAYLDGFLIAAELPFAVLRRLFFVGAAEYFTSPLMRGIARAANIVPVDPDANLVSAMQAASAGLRTGKILMLFPEGERSIDGGLKPFRKGAAILASHLDVPVVPVALDGLFEVWPRGRSLNWRLLAPWRRHRLSLTFLSPRQLGGVAYDQGTDQIRSDVARALDSFRASSTNTR